MANRRRIRDLAEIIAAERTASEPRFVMGWTVESGGGRPLGPRVARTSGSILAAENLSRVSLAVRSGS